MKSVYTRLMMGFILFSLIVVGMADTSQAAEFRGGDNVVIGANEVIDDDLFVSGNRIEINGTIRGDLFVSGNDVSVNGPVEGSLMIAGQTLRVNGKIGGSLYSGGYSLNLGPQGHVVRNLYFGGFSLKTETGSVIGRGLHSGNYQTMLNGTVAHDVMLASSAFELNGTVGGDVFAEVSAPDGASPPVMPFFSGSVPTIPPGFRMADSSNVAGALDITETAPDQSGPDGVQIGTLTIAATVARRIGEFIALLIVGGLLLYFGPSFMEKASDVVRANPLPSTGWGFLITLIFFIAVPIVALVIFLLALLGGFVTLGQLFGDIMMLGGTTLALLVTLFVIVLAVVTKSIVAYLGGRLILTRFMSDADISFANNFLALTMGLIIYELLRAIPFGLGWLFGVLATLTGLGAIYFLLRQDRRFSFSKRSAAPAPRLSEKPA